MVVFGQSGSIRAKAVVFLKSECTRARAVVLFVQGGCIQAKMVVIGKKLL